ncbi:MAG TPA: DUF2339 domain-containing protein [Puia sp.]|jgi:uncharacterized membrane protein|nr:DUF2339 domain-containing protein [Puia sp.]
MEIFLLLVILILILVCLSFLLRSRQKLGALTEDISLLRKKLNQLIQQPAVDPNEKWKPTGVATPEKKPPETIAPESISQQVELTKIEIPAPPLAKEIPNIGSQPSPSPVRTPEPEKSFAPKSSSLARSSASSPEKISWFQQWLHDNPDMEKFIGENLINKIGIGVLVLGIAFFVKYAIDQEWINKVGRVCVGLFCGIALLGIAHRLRKHYHSFSSVLVGGGLAVFYFTIAFAFHQYHLISQDAAFAIIVVITVFAVMLSVLYDRMELGIIATVGGFITPFIVSTGNNNYFALFSYLSILNAGLIVLAYYKRWRALNFLAFFFTEIIYLGWIIGKIGEPNFPYKDTFGFGAVFYAMFVGMNVIHHVSSGSKLKSFDFIVLLSVNLFFYVSGMYLLQQWGNEIYKGPFTAVLGVINLILAFLFFRRSKADKNFIYLLIGITVTFISLTAPVQLKGNYITMFWSAEMVVLLWLYQKSFILLVKIASVFVSLLMIVSLLMDWSEVFGPGSDIIPILLNKGFVTGFFASLAMGVSYSLMRREADTFFLGGITNAEVKIFYLSGAIALIFCSGILEIYYQFSKRFQGSGLEFVYLQLYVIAFYLLLTFIVQKLRIRTDKNIRLALPLVLFSIYAFNTGNIYFAEKNLLVTAIYKSYFYANWISVLLLLLLGWNTIHYLRENKSLFTRQLTFFTWLIALAIVLLLSVEIEHLFVWLNYSTPALIENTENIYSKAGLSIVWGLSSFSMIWLGMSSRFKPLRIIALVVFGITLVKLFVFDISNISPGGKITAFILLGVLLLVVSFMYQRLKKIIIDDAGSPQ